MKKKDAPSNVSIDMLNSYELERVISRRDTIIISYPWFSYTMFPYMYCSTFSHCIRSLAQYGDKRASVHRQVDLSTLEDLLVEQLASL